MAGGRIVHDAYMRRVIDRECAAFRWRCTHGSGLNHNWTQALKAQGRVDRRREGRRLCAEASA